MPIISKRKLVTLVTYVAVLISIAIVEKVLFRTTQYEWDQPVRAGSQAVKIAGSMTRRMLFARGLSLDIRFKNGHRMTWIGEASHVPVGLVERGQAVFLVLLDWDQVAAGAKLQSPQQGTVCVIEVQDIQRPENDALVTPLFVPTSLGIDWRPWGYRVQVAPEVVLGSRLIGENFLLARTSMESQSTVSHCPDLRRADNI